MTKTAAKTHRLFMRRSYECYRDLKKRSLSQELPFTLEELRDKIRAAIDRKACPYLGRFGEAVTAKTFSVDHSTPVSRGGDDSLKNLVVCTRSANFAKGILTNQEFQKLLKALADMDDAARSDVIGRLKAGAAVVRLRFLGRQKKT